MEKVNTSLIKILCSLFIIGIIVVIYFVFINAKTKFEFDESKRINSDYEWVLSDMKDEVRELNNDLVSYFDYSNKADMNSLEYNGTLDYKNNNKMDMPLYKHNEYLVFNSSLNDEHDIDIILICANGKAYDYNIRNKKDNKNKVIKYDELPKCKYHIFVKDNNKIFDSLRYIKVEK